ncbi:MAG: tRNA pseudouridine(13) synthase TruD [Candidatus Lambdaproteobacteria bacterium]|nr:tRNA pseudouridine(13) synthase TruD [Candidatus Lambdaproteobacteria bacterium]
MMPFAYLPYLTPELPGCGGVLKARPEDFVVEEMPAYDPSGQGEHVYLWIEKRGLSTPAAMARLSEASGCRKRSMGHAGLKDAQAVSRQWISVHTVGEPPFHQAESDALRILRVTRHVNKLRVGHLRGNRFMVTVRGVEQPTALAAIFARLARQGFPNYYGAQRFGLGGDNAAAGRDLLLALQAADAAPVRRRRDPLRARLLLNAYQSALFNALLARRLRAGNVAPEPPDGAADVAPEPAEGGEALPPGFACDPLGTLLPGDVAIKHDSGGCFLVQEDNLADAQGRAAAHLLSPTAPMFGYKTLRAEGHPGTWEAALLAREGLTPKHFAAGGALAAKGVRRAVRAFADELTWDVKAEDGAQALQLSFTLPRGVYATALLREVMKPGPRTDGGCAEAPGAPCACAASDAAPRTPAASAAVAAIPRTPGARP